MVIKRADYSYSIVWIQDLKIYTFLAIVTCCFRLPHYDGDVENPTAAL